MPVAQGGRKMGITKIKKVQSLCNWTCLRKASGQNLSANEFTEDQLNQVLDNMEVNKKFNEDGRTVKSPMKFEPMKWVSWERSFRNYLFQLKSKVSGISLAYVIRKLVPAGYRFIDQDKFRLHNIVLRGNIFNEDNKEVYQILKEDLVNTVAWVWICDQNCGQDGRVARISLAKHYDGPGECNK